MEFATKPTPLSLVSMVFSVSKVRLHNWHCTHQTPWSGWRTSLPFYLIININMHTRTAADPNSPRQDNSLSSIAPTHPELSDHSSLAWWKITTKMTPPTALKSMCSQQGGRVGWQGRAFNVLVNYWGSDCKRSGHSCCLSINNNKAGPGITQPPY